MTNRVIDNCPHNDDEASRSGRAYHLPESGERVVGDEGQGQGL